MRYPGAVEHIDMRLHAGPLFVLWMAWGAALLTLAVAAWLDAPAVQAVITAIQTAYGTQPNPAWLLRADLHVHATVSCMASLWFGLGCRLFIPRGLPWIPIALTVLVCLSDEVAQIGSAERTFEWSDQLGDAVGLTVSFPLLLLLVRLKIAGPQARPG